MGVDACGVYQAAGQPSGVRNPHPPEDRATRETVGDRVSTGLTTVHQDRAIGGSARCVLGALSEKAINSTPLSEARCPKLWLLWQS